MPGYPPGGTPRDTYDRHRPVGRSQKSGVPHFVYNCSRLRAIYCTEVNSGSEVAESHANTILCCVLGPFHTLKYISSIPWTTQRGENNCHLLANLQLLVANYSTCWVSAIKATLTFGAMSFSFSNQFVKLFVNRMGVQQNVVNNIYVFS